MGTPTDFPNNVMAVHRSSEPDPLVLELCMGTGPSAWVDLMLEELAASLLQTALGRIRAFLYKLLTS